MCKQWFRGNSARKPAAEKYRFQEKWNRALLFMTAAMVLMLLAISLFYTYSTRNLQENVRLSLQQSLEQQKLNIDFRLRSLKEVDSSLLNVIWPIVCSDTDWEGQYEEYNQLKSILSLYEASQYVSNIRLYVPDSKYYSTQGSTIYGFSQLPDTIRLDDMDTIHLLNGFQSEPQVVQIAEDYSGLRVPKNVLTYAHFMRHKKDYNTLACVLMLDVEIANFQELLSTDSAFDAYGYIVNSDGICMATADKAQLSQQVIGETVLAQMHSDATGILEADGQVYLYGKLEECDWYVVMHYPNGIFSSLDSAQIRLLRMITALIALVTLSMVFLLVYYYMMNVTLSRINTTLDALDTGKEPEAAQRGNPLNPFHKLERNADRVVLTVKQLMEKCYRDQLEIAQTQMQSLQAQIKPHFLYNTLDIIKWMILDNKAEDAVWMVNALSRYLRQSINKGPSVVSLEQELELSHTYLELMQKRFENRFRVEYEVERDACSCMLPKLLLQPLLENALFHGILYCRKPELLLIVRAWVADGQLCAEVEDNGSGMTEEQRKALEEGRIGYGFANVCKRLRLFSENQAEVHVFSREGVGTCIALQLPARAVRNAASPSMNQ